jgi:DNA polymerase-3 subunit alpha
VDGRTVSRKVLEALIKSGACDALGENRATLFARIDHTLARAASIAQDRQRGQASLFGMFSENTPAADQDDPDKLPEWPQSEMLAAEKELLGIFVTGHPLTPYSNILEKYSLSNTTTAGQVQNRGLTRLGGMITALQQGISKKSNKPYAMVTIEDLLGTIQMLCMNENYDKFRELLVLNKAVLVIGEINNGEDKPKIFPQEIIPLEDAPRRYTKQVHLRINLNEFDSARLEALAAVVKAHPGKCPLFLCVRQRSGEMLFIEAHERFAVAPSIQFQRAIDEQFGPDTYYAKADTSLPERTLRRWERKTDNGDGEN